MRLSAYKSAFSLIEILVVLGLVIILATIFLPRLTRRSPSLDWKAIQYDLNNIVFFTRQEAIANHGVYRLVYKSNQNGSDTITIESEYPDPENAERKLYKQVQSYYFSTVYTFAPSIKLKALYLGKQEMLEEQRGVAYCYIVPDGLVQPIVIHMTRKTSHDETGASFIMNPFFGQFDFSYEFVKPGAL